MWRKKRGEVGRQSDGGSCGTDGKVAKQTMQEQDRSCLKLKSLRSIRMEVAANAMVFLFFLLTGGLDGLK